jgi:hypothetical protein
MEGRRQGNLVAEAPAPIETKAKLTIHLVGDRVREEGCLGSGLRRGRSVGLLVLDQCLLPPAKRTSSARRHIFF